MKYSDSNKQRTNERNMAVNSKLVTLMRVIEDNQDKMTEGEYLEAMNALAALHRDVPPLSNRRHPSSTHRYHHHLATPLRTKHRQLQGYSIVKCQKS